jgi:hypothetical protein
VLPILQFDIVDESVLDYFLTFDEDTQEANNAHILDQMEDLGYDTHNSVLLLGTLGILALWYWSRVLLYILVLVPFVLLTGRGMKTAKNLRN